MMHAAPSRRSFLKTAAGVAAATPFIRRMEKADAATRKFDPDFGTATEAVRALRAGAISSRELVTHTFSRIRKYNPKVNAFITLAEEQAIARANEADEALAAGRAWGTLHGLPIVIKDAFETAGIRTTSGSKTLENYIPQGDAVAVGRLKAAGAIIIGKTNMPEFAGDVQSYNAIAGTTNNPWDARRTPGGSTGGGAAALAAGLGFLELGSDIGGSIRTPCSFCGVYGLKPTLNVVPTRGHIPPPPGTARAIVDLNVTGPMARSAQDLSLELEVIGGPAPGDDRAYRWRLPAPRATRLKEYRIGFVLDDPFCPVTPEVKEVLGGAIDSLRRQGAQLEEGWPKDVAPQETFDVYIRLLSAFFAPQAVPSNIQLLRESVDKPWGYYARKWLEGTDALHKDWLGWSGLRLKARNAWEYYFSAHDAFLLPTDFVPAIPHDHELSFFERSLSTSQGSRSYGDVLRWICFATLTGNPAVVAPAGLTKQGLPVGLQIMGPYLEDATAISVAGLLADAVGGFRPPPGFGA